MEANLVPGMTYGSSYFPEACGIANKFNYNKVTRLMLDGVLTRASLKQLSIMPLDSGKNFTASLSITN